MTARPMYKGMMDVTYIPGAAGWLEATLVSALEQSLVEPNMLVVDVEKLAANNVMLPNFVPERSTVPLTASVDNKQSTSIAIVHIEIFSAKQLRAADRNGLSDPFVAISLGPSSRKTTVKKKTLNPTWNEKFQLPISSWDLPNILILRVRDKDIVFHDELGYTSLSLLLMLSVTFVFHFLCHNQLLFFIAL
jgi:Ca2+-dependent lipid-binding protein